MVRADIVRLLQYLALPLGLLYRGVLLALDGARDISNAVRFSSAQVDADCRIDRRTQLGERVHVLDHCILNNVSIDQYSYIGRNSLIQNAAIGAYCSIANDVMIGMGNHPVDHFSTSPLFYRVRNTFGLSLVKQDMNFAEYQPIKVGNDVWIGCRATVLDGVTIGDGAIIAAGAVVTKDVAPYAIVGGVPARVIRSRFSEETAANIASSQWWRLPPEEAMHRMAPESQQ